MIHITDEEIDALERTGGRPIAHLRIALAELRGHRAYLKGLRGMAGKVLSPQQLESVRREWKAREETLLSEGGGIGTLAMIDINDIFTTFDHLLPLVLRGEPFRGRTVPVTRKLKHIRIDLLKPLETYGYVYGEERLQAAIEEVKRAFPERKLCIVRAYTLTAAPAPAPAEATRHARQYMLLHPEDCDPPHGLDMTPGGRDEEKVEDLVMAFTKDGFAAHKAALVGYPLNGRVQLLSGTHRHEAAKRAGIRLPVALVLRSDVEAAWGHPEAWARLIADVPVEELEQAEVKIGPPPPGIDERVDLTRDRLDT